MLDMNYITDQICNRRTQIFPFSNIIFIFIWNPHFYGFKVLNAKFHQICPLIFCDCLSCINCCKISSVWRLVKNSLHYISVFLNNLLNSLMSFLARVIHLQTELTGNVVFHSWPAGATCLPMCPRCAFNADEQRDWVLEVIEQADLSPNLVPSLLNWSVSVSSGNYKIP